MKKTLLVIALLASGCIDFAAKGTEACTQRGLCKPGDAIGDGSYCSPCVEDINCFAGAICLRSIGRESVCGADCSVSPCPTGSTCQRIQVNGSDVATCVPSPRKCDGGM